MSKYDAIGIFLNSKDTSRVTLTYSEINEIVEIPPSAWGTDRTWYGNTRRKSQGKSWLAAGWKVEDVFNGTVTFCRMNK